MSNFDRMRKDLERLSEEGDNLHLRMVLDTSPERIKGEDRDKLKKLLPEFGLHYQRWYSESLAMLSVILPDRVTDCKSFYQLPRPPKELNYTTYTISDYLKGTTSSYGGRPIATPKAADTPMNQQVAIVKAAIARFESSLFDIKAMAQADLFDNELDSAIHLNKNGFARAAGAVAGVVLEGHLATVCATHSITLTKKKPTMGRLLRSAEIRQCN